ncbi:unnamed protein product [marine sediment metagenome]|uniref:Uncharacterized protein n=1 Tax=marine sediment metagenome TaxID=412755 RepID=X1SSV1_9ZZZZ
MSKYNNDYNDKILRIRAEFINFLKKDLEKRLDTFIDQKEIRTSIYKFIFDRVADKGIKVIKGKNKKKERFFNFFVNTVDWCLSYGFIIIDTLSDLKRVSDRQV